MTRARPWYEHLELHRAVQDLTVVAGWRDYGLWDLEVNRHTDPVRALGGNVLHERWARVRTYEVTPPTIDADRSRFLFNFDTVGERGLRRWVRVRRDHRRAIAGMIHSVGIKGMALETAISEAGAALEFLGHGLAVEQGIKPVQHLATLLGYVTSSVRSELPLDPDLWPASFAKIYNTVKHPDRLDDIDPVVMSNSLREARLIFRAWVAERIGANPSVIERNLRIDPMSHPYEAMFKPT